MRAAAPLEALVPRWLAGPEWRSARPPSTRPPESVVSATLEWRGALRRAALEAFLGSLPPLLRGKGLARLEDGRRWRFDWAGAEWVWEPAPDAPGRDSAILMLAAERLDEAALQAAFESCAAQNA
ncbi:MAG: hypothetical protein BWZ10_01020 [candidate division BRC1 bacterium ADurb.BinA364]|nr:MAG: hypothetical protein BWZ10_01020 [candidate division BRC1 bacterium ADurb.BinA364]